jgi:hypothetical protein
MKITKRIDSRADVPPQVMTYTLSLTVKRAVSSWQQGETSAEIAEAAKWMAGREAQRDLEKEVLRALRTLDGDYDVEVMEVTIETED